MSEQRERTFKRLRLLPIQAIKSSEGIILARGCTQLRIAGAGSAEALRLLLAATEGAGATLEEICTLFPTAAHHAVEQLVGKLVSNRILVETEDWRVVPDHDESPLDVFYWEFQQTPHLISQLINRTHIGILGVNTISRQLMTSLSAVGALNCEILDIPRLRNPAMFNTDGELIASHWPAHLKPPTQSSDQDSIEESLVCDLIVATSQSGDSDVLRDWNRRCVRQKTPFLPILLKDLIGYVGPFTIPGETACYECFTARQTSNTNKDLDQEMAPPAFRTQPVIGFHPCMPSILGDLAAFELTKFLGNFLPHRNAGALIEVRLLTMQFLVRKPLKVPRCAVCSPLHDTAASAIRKEPFTPISRLQT